MMPVVVPTLPIAPEPMRVYAAGVRSPAAGVASPTVHDGSHSCKLCGKKFQTSVLLRGHLQQNHGHELPYQCHVCSKKFFWSGSLSRHLRIHSGTKPYSCSICNKSFTQSGTLQRHTRTHTGEKPYECKLCWRKFSTNSNLSQHMKTHRKNGDRQLPRDGVVVTLPTSMATSLTGKNVSLRHVVGGSSSGWHDGKGSTIRVISASGGASAGSKDDNGTCTPPYPRGASVGDLSDEVNEEFDSVDDEESSIETEREEMAIQGGIGGLLQMAKAATLNSPVLNGQCDVQITHLRYDQDEEAIVAQQLQNLGRGQQLQQSVPPPPAIPTIHYAVHCRQRPVQHQRIEVPQFINSPTSNCFAPNLQSGGTPGTFQMRIRPCSPDSPQVCESEMFLRRREAAEKMFKGSPSHSAFAAAVSLSK
ncbi:C2H2-type domain-containing protein [Plasmodiophora brassicae]